MKRSCHAAAFASWRRVIMPRSRNEPASASADERRSSVRSRSKNAAAATSGFQAGRCERRFAVWIVLDARHPAAAHDDDLEQPREHSLRAEPRHVAAAELDEHTISEIEELGRAHPVHARAPEQRAHDLVRVLARLPRPLAGGFPTDAVVEELAQLF